ncbi:MAG: hypothetical protein JSS11_07545 [Verrucomicrobia bacterium]|nr:hypothetical protein [Verrucomicrobiota bacterium]
MTESHKAHDEIIAALRERRYESLVIKRFETRHYLIVVIKGRPRVFADHTGKHKEYRHTWQIRSWLQEQFDIPGETATLETISA